MGFNALISGGKDERAGRQLEEALVDPDPLYLTASSVSNIGVYSTLINHRSSAPESSLSWI